VSVRRVVAPAALAHLIGEPRNIAAETRRPVERAAQFVSWRLGLNLFA
jgi:hypothetical protein